MPPRRYTGYITGADLDYVGSITIDGDLMDRGLMEWERPVLDITNGNRLETYVIEGARGPGKICINGRTHLINPGDLVIILAYSGIEENMIQGHLPTVVHVDENNQQIHDL